MGGHVLSHVLDVPFQQWDWFGARIRSIPSRFSAHVTAFPGTSLAVQQRAITCLVNAARRQAGRPLLATPPKLRRAAAIKGHRVVSCGQFSHTPCGAAATAAIRAAGYRYAWFGENLFAGTWGEFTPRQVVESWLGSPGHRANILRPSFRVFGASRVLAQDIFGEAQTAVWVATFASPR